jgi:predicted CXXCH cytochrome family protein
VVLALARWGAALVVATAVASQAEAAPTRQYAGSQHCAACHRAEYDAWAGSLHAAAARIATPTAVGAPFDGRWVSGASASAVARRIGNRLALESHPVGLVLGRAAVEQFLLPMRGGRWQAFPIAYDPAGREWFDVFPEGPGPDAWNHWTNPGATANGLCLDCHVTGFSKGYDAAADSYATRWAELGVGCEACHGPGVEHAEEAGAGVTPPLPYGRLVSPGPAVAVCAPCHALRLPLTDAYNAGDPLPDHFDFELLDSDAFAADGRVRAEAYEWTSYRTSRMAAAGVTCGACHDPHAGTLRAGGNDLCLRCHVPDLASPAHTHHPPASDGARCVGCHMPEVVFMERDRRRDHALSRPDPIRAATIGAPDACTGCHAGEAPSWVRERFEAWYGEGTRVLRTQRALATLLEAGRRGDVESAVPLARLLGSGLDEVWRASAGRVLGRMQDLPVEAIEGLRAATEDQSAFVRAAAVRALGEVEDPGARPALVRAAEDPRRLVRFEAAFALRDADVSALPASERPVVERVFAEWVTGQAPLADRPEVRFNEGVFWTSRGDVRRAEAAYRTAIRLWADDPAPRQNLAMLLAGAGRTADAVAELHEVLARRPAWPPASFALGVVYAGVEQWPKAIRAFEACLEADASYPEAAYRLGLAHRGAGNEQEAIAAFERAAGDPMSRRDALRTLVRLHVERNDREAVMRWLPESLLADPAVASDPAVRGVLGVGPATENQATEAR